MAKRLFLLLFSSFIGIFGGPEILMASDNYLVNGLDNSRITKTVIEEEQPSEDQQEPSNNQTGGVASSYVQRSTYVQSAPVYTPPANSISVAGKVIDVVSVSDTSIDAGNHVNKYGDRFFYGHNSANVFGGIVGLGVGSVFSITQNGVTQNYQVVKIVIYEKNASSGRLQLNGSGNYMRQVANAKSEGVQYSVSLMTCYGQSLGGGDATHRFVIFANTI